MNFLKILLAFTLGVVVTLVVGRPRPAPQIVVARPAPLELVRPESNSASPREGSVGTRADSPGIPPARAADLPLRDSTMAARRRALARTLRALERTMPTVEREAPDDESADPQAGSRVMLQSILEGFDARIDQQERADGGNRSRD